MSARTGLYPIKDRSRIEDLHAEFFTKIEPPNFGVFCQVAGGAGAENLSLGHDVSAVGHAQGFAYIVIGNQDSDTAIT